MKKRVECDCVNPNVCPDCRGTGFVEVGKILPSDKKIAEDCLASTNAAV